MEQSDRVFFYIYPNNIFYFIKNYESVELHIEIPAFVRMSLAGVG